MVGKGFMWNTSVKIEYIAGLIYEALENYSVNECNTYFNSVIEELKKYFPNCNDKEIMDILSLCMILYSSKKTLHVELVLTAPESFRMNTIKNKGYTVQIN